MMKKFLIFMLVLGMASLASATLQISVGGNPDPVDSEIYLLPSEEIELDIVSVGGNTGIAEGAVFYFALISNMAKGVVNGATGRTLIPPAPDASALLGWAGALGLVGMPAGYDGLLGTVGAFTANPPYANGIYFDQIVFHCEAPIDAIILLGGVDAATQTWTGVIYDSVVIHQIPEPATIALLGLGGLLLRRRK
jgi:hypothetical protein